MREIKFRAWDKDIKTFVPMMEWIEEFKNSKLRYLGKEVVVSSNSIANLFTVLTHKDIEIMQYSGLKDKNGKEIYTGDIVKYFDLLEEKENLGTIYFSDGSFDIDNCFLLYNKINCCEVVGNIYENKLEDFE